MGEFSYRTRKKAIERFRTETFDLLIIGGGITGAAVARDAVSRGLSVALVEKQDFAYGTSSRSSKLIHGGLRYLQNFEFALVFEALAERSLLLKTTPHLVRPLPFYLPVYEGDPNGPGKLNLGLWLYDLLALFRTPGFHRRLSRKNLLQEIPFLKSEGLEAGFRYFDASMWDDALAVETLRSAQEMGAAVANYVEARKPVWEGDRIVGFGVHDLEGSKGEGEIFLRAHKTILCAGPWTDEMGKKLSPAWKPWLNPSKGVHLIFDLKRIPIPGAMVMSHPEDGRISFVIPRTDFGAGVVIVGTTDGPTPADPDAAGIDEQDVEYLMCLLKRYFPSLNLTHSDILSAYIGVRPLVGGAGSLAGSEGQGSGALQKVSREHHIDHGPGGTVVVAGGKYTTHRKMAEEIVEFTLKGWKKDRVGPSRTRQPVNVQVTVEATARAQVQAEQENIKLPVELLGRYGANALPILKDKRSVAASSGQNPEGFPQLESQLRYAMQNEMVIRLEDFYLRRIPLYAARKDHGLPWAEALSQVWAEERGLTSQEAAQEKQRLQSEIAKRSSWQKE